MAKDHGSWRLRLTSSGADDHHPLHGRGAAGEAQKNAATTTGRQTGEAGDAAACTDEAQAADTTENAPKCSGESAPQIGECAQYGAILTH